jgi:transcriptional regulator with XRE-family HTH domain
MTAVGDAIPAWAIALRTARRHRGWSQLRLVHELRAVADEARRKQLPSDESMVRRVSSWENGAHQPDELYQQLLAAVFPELIADGSDRAADSPPSPAQRPLPDHGIPLVLPR